MSPRHPLLLDVTGRLVVVVGGGPVAARRVRSLLTDGAVVRLVAPALCEDLADLAAAGAVTWHAREYAPGDLDDAWLVHTATGDPRTDAAVAAAAEAARTWCVRADDAASSTAWTPAVARADDVTVAVTAGGDPRRALALRAAVQTLLETGALPVRRHRPGAGHVALVGGGPGDPGLITTRGRRALAEADVVVVDRLAPRALLDELEPGVEVVEAGKAPHAHTLTQDEINRLLVERARAGQRVVRLKGGDPFVYGRGGEEVLACRAAGVPVDVVPGVSSALSVPALAGIPLTHRGTVAAFHVVSGHDGLDAAALAGVRDRTATLVVLMGVSQLARITAQALDAGADPALPVAIVENGSTPRQRVTRAPLGEVVERAAQVGVRAPAIIVVGHVAAAGRLEPDPATVA